MTETITRAAHYVGVLVSFVVYKVACILKDFCKSSWHVVSNAAPDIARSKGGHGNGGDYAEVVEAAFEGSPKISILGRIGAHMLA